MRRGLVYLSRNLLKYISKSSRTELPGPDVVLDSSKLAPFSTYKKNTTNRCRNDSYQHQDTLELVYRQPPVGMIKPDVDMVFKDREVDISTRTFYSSEYSMIKKDQYRKIIKAINENRSSLKPSR